MSVCILFNNDSFFFFLLQCNPLLEYIYIHLQDKGWVYWSNSYVIRKRKKQGSGTISCINRCTRRVNILYHCAAFCWPRLLIILIVAILLFAYSAAYKHAVEQPQQHGCFVGPYHRWNDYTHSGEREVPTNGIKRSNRPCHVKVKLSTLSFFLWRTRYLKWESGYYRTTSCKKTHTHTCQTCQGNKRNKYKKGVDNEEGEGPKEDDVYKGSRVNG